MKIGKKRISDIKSDKVRARAISLARDYKDGDLLEAAFIWNSTDEGHYYWQGVNESIVRIGDEVTIDETNMCAETTSHKGKKGIVIDIDMGYEYPYKVYFDNGRKFWSTIKTK